MSIFNVDTEKELQEKKELEKLYSLWRQDRKWFYLWLWEDFLYLWWFNLPGLVFSVAFFYFSFKQPFGVTALALVIFLLASVSFIFIVGNCLLFYTLFLWLINFQIPDDLILTTQAWVEESYSARIRFFLFSILLLPLLWTVAI